MTTVYHELLPQSYPLLLAPGRPYVPEYALHSSLRCACCSGKPAVWVGCGLLGHGLTKEAARSRRNYRRLLPGQRQTTAVYASDEVKAARRKRRLTPSLCCASALPGAAGPGNCNSHPAA